MTRFRTSGVIRESFFSARETVVGETFAREAISTIVTFIGEPAGGTAGDSKEPRAEELAVPTFARRGLSSVLGVEMKFSTSGVQSFARISDA